LKFLLLGNGADYYLLSLYWEMVFMGHQNIRKAEAFILLMGITCLMVKYLSSLIQKQYQKKRLLSIQDYSMNQPYSFL